MFNVIRVTKIQGFGRLVLLLQHEVWDDAWILVRGVGRARSIGK